MSCFPGGTITDSSLAQEQVRIKKKEKEKQALGSILSVIHSFTGNGRSQGLRIDLPTLALLICIVFLSFEL